MLNADVGKKKLPIHQTGFGISWLHRRSAAAALESGFQATQIQFSLRFLRAMAADALLSEDWENLIFERNFLSNSSAC